MLYFAEANNQKQNDMTSITKQKLDNLFRNWLKNVIYLHRELVKGENCHKRVMPIDLEIEAMKIDRGLVQLYERAALKCEENFEFFKKINNRFMRILKVVDPEREFNLSVYSELKPKSVKFIS